MDIVPGSPKVFYKGEQVHIDAIIPRIAASYTFYGAAVVRQFEMGGCPHFKLITWHQPIEE